MRDVNLSYIAGLFDGEGSVSFCFLKARNGKRYGKLMARISQNDRRVLDWVQTTIGLGTVHLRNRPGRTDAHDFIVSNEAARQFLAAIRPFLIVKGERVDEKLALDRHHVSPRKKSV